MHIHKLHGKTTRKLQNWRFWVKTVGGHGVDKPIFRVEEVFMEKFGCSKANLGPPRK